MRVAPTLVKYANASEYELKTRAELAHAATEIMRDAAIQSAPLVDLVEDAPLEVEIAATQLYSACHYSYRQGLERVQSLPSDPRDQSVNLRLHHLGPHHDLR